MQDENEQKIQQTYQKLVEAEQKRMENEYRQKSDEIARKWKKQLDEEKSKLQKVFFFLLPQKKSLIYFISKIGI